MILFIVLIVNTLSAGYFRQSDYGYREGRVMQRYSNRDRIYTNYANRISASKLPYKERAQQYNYLACTEQLQNMYKKHRIVAQESSLKGVNDMWKSYLECRVWLSKSRLYKPLRYSFLE